MFADLRGLHELRSSTPLVLQSLIFHDDDYVACVSVAGATPDTFVSCKQTWCSTNAWKNHERCDSSTCPSLTGTSHAA